MAYDSSIQLKVLAAHQVYYQGEAYAVSSVNDLGPFDVLEGHVSFISIIKDRVIIHKTASEKVEIPITNGVLQVQDGKVVSVFIGF